MLQTRLTKTPSYLKTAEVSHTWHYVIHYEVLSGILFLCQVHSTPYSKIKLSKIKAIYLVSSTCLTSGIGGQLKTLQEILTAQGTQALIPPAGEALSTPHRTLLPICAQWFCGQVPLRSSRLLLPTSSLRTVPHWVPQWKARAGLHERGEGF